MVFHDVDEFNIIDLLNSMMMVWETHNIIILFDQPMIEATIDFSPGHLTIRHGRKQQTTVL